MLARIIGLIAAVLCANPVIAQIRGTVVDRESAVPILGVHVVTDKESTITDKDGIFFLENVAKQIIISHISYITDTLKGNAIYNKLVVALKPIVQEIEPVNISGHLNEFPIALMPASVGYISAKAVDEVNDISIIQNLNRIPGIFAHSGAINTNRITIRGIGSRTPYGTNRIKAYYKDIPLTTGDGTTELEDFNASDIGSIEVLKGSKSALYGSGLGGVILLNKANYSEGLHASAKVSAASYKTLKTELGVQFKQKGFYTRGSVSNNQTNGWRQNSAYNRTNLTFNTGYSNIKNHVDFLLLYVKTKAHIPSSINKQTFINAPDSAAQNWLSIEGNETYTKLISGITYKHSFSQNINNKTSLFVQSYNGIESRPFNILDDGATKLGIRNISSLRFNHTKIQAGIESMLDIYNWSIYETLDGKRGNLESKYSEKRYPFSVFLNGQYQPNTKLILEGGISLNYLSYFLEDKSNTTDDLSGDYRYKPILSPFLGINLAFNNTFRIYSSVSNGFSAPSVEETLLPEGSINPGLKPETGLNAEIGTRFKSENNRVYVDACLYGIWVSNLLVTKRETEDIFYGANAGKTWHRGVEISSNFYLTDRNSKYPALLNINYSLTQATFTDYMDDGIELTGNILPGIPLQRLYMSANIKSLWGVSFTPIFQYSGEQFLDDANTLSYESFQLLHLKTGYSKRIGKANIEISFVIWNMFNEQYASMILVNAPSFGGKLPRYYYPGMPRNYSLSVSIGW